LGANTSTAPFAVPPLASLPSQQVLFRQRFLSSPPASAAQVCSAGAGSERRKRSRNLFSTKQSWKLYNIGPNPTRLECMAHQLKAIFDTEFAIDIVKVNLDGSLANAEVARNNLVL